MSKTELSLVMVRVYKGSRYIIKYKVDFISLRIDKSINITKVKYDVFYYSKVTIKLGNLFYFISPGIQVLFAHDTSFFGLFDIQYAEIKSIFYH